MRQAIKTWSIVLTVVAVMASCISSDNTEAVLYGDAAITSFTLGTLNRYTTVTTEDTSYVQKTTLAGSNYKCSIDQIGRTVCNTDSLPVGTDVHHVVCTIVTKNNGLTVIKDIDSDTLRYYNSADSIDFSEPRTFYVYSSDGTGFNTYTIWLNVHQEEADGFVWQQTESAWSPAADTTQLPDTIKQLLGGSTTEQYALSTDNRLLVLRDGEWQEDALDEDVSLLPVQDLALVSYPMALADSTDYVLLVGNRSVSEYPQETVAVVWRKIVDYSKNAPASHWTYMERTDNNLLALPRMQNLTIVKYDDGILALGGAGIGGCTLAPYTQFYQSRDNGITWKYNARYQLPEEFDASASRVLMSTDDDNFLWLHCTGTGQVWRGRLNRLGWK